MTFHVFIGNETDRRADLRIVEAGLGGDDLDLGALTNLVAGRGRADVLLHDPEGLSKGPELVAWLGHLHPSRVQYAILAKRPTRG